MTKLLVLNFFPAFHPPSSGGEQRYYYIYYHLSRWFDITLLSPTFSDRQYEVVPFNPTFREHRVPKEDVHLRLHRELDQVEIGPECSALVCALAANTANEYHHRYRELIADADIVIHESPFMVDYDERMEKDGKPRVYNSYNVEAELMGQMLAGPQKDRHVSHIAELEARLVRESALVFATSNAERASFERRYGCDARKLALAPNGFEPASADDAALSAGDDRAIDGLPPNAADPLAMFIGSGHPPNIEAARYIIERLAPSLPSLRFAIAGSVCRWLHKAPANVALLGLLTPEQKTRLFRRCNVALNPMFSGAGTNLKMLDFMSSGLPIVTTPIGARGLDVENGLHCIIAESDHVADAVATLVGNASDRMRLGDAARSLAYERYTWRSIAESMRDRLTSLIETPSAASSRHRRKQILLLNDFPAADASAGGEVRIARLFAAVAERHEVTLLCLTDAAEISEKQIAPNFREIAIPKTVEHRELQQGLDQKHHISVSDIVSAAMCTKNDVLVEMFRILAAESDVVVFEHPYLVPLLDVSMPPKRVVYEAFNVEATLKRAMLAEHPDRDALLQRVASLEARACSAADLVVCVSDEDRVVFESGGGRDKTLVIHNGVDIRVADARAIPDSLRSLFGDRHVAIFIGSGHFPNIEAVRYIVGELAPAHQDVVFLIVGSAAQFFSSRTAPGNVLLCGRVEDEVKDALLALADVAVNPMLSGGGSSLKVPEYMAASLPVVTTKIGIRGYDVIDGVHAVVADTADFSRRLTEVLANREWRDSIGARGRDFAREHLDWRRLGARYGEAIERLIETKPHRSPASNENALTERRRRLLIVTYRLTDPPLGGAEAFLLATLKELHAIGHFDIDVATLAVRDIANHLHFSATYAPHADAREDFSSFLRSVRKFAVDAVDERAVLSRCGLLFDLWQREDLTQARLFESVYEDLTLLGGWFHPEQLSSGVQRWTGPTAELYCPAGTSRLTLRGIADRRKTVTVCGKGMAPQSWRVDGRFDIAVALDGFSGGICRIDVDPAYRAGADPRKLGVCVTNIVVERAGVTTEMSLLGDFAATMRAKDPVRWVRSLIDVTNARNLSDDSMFLAARGPHSRALEAWLDDHVGDYDVVLAHGVPFSTSATGVRFATRHGVPSVVLPHFHMEDKYYHWRDYYRMFEAADRVIVAPSSAKSVFFDRIGADSVVIPGGGIDPREFEETESHVRAFRSLHRASDPFVLVLGRKSGAKNYGAVVDAVDALNRNGTRLDLVMIGPDDDRKPVDGTHVRYYGNQPRSVVLGALAECLCLANMSDSESFGIVILEAWMSGRPVVANRGCGAFAELVQHGRNGFLCESEVELTEAIERLLDRPQEADAFGRYGRLIATEGYTWQAIAASIDAALRSVCGDGGSDAALRTADSTPVSA